MSTYFPKEGDIARKWFVVDASGLPLGRLASRVARILMGKESPKYTPFIDTGDHVVIINADKVKVTGMKTEQKMYHHYTGYPGGIRSEEMKKRLVRKPELIIEDAVSRMLPKMCIRDSLIDVALEHLQKFEVGIARVLDVVRQRLLDIANIARFEIHRTSAASRGEDGHSSLPAHEVLPLVGIWMPVQFADPARMHSHDRRRDGC